jgi:hypothetical protein
VLPSGTDHVGRDLGLGFHQNEATLPKFHLNRFNNRQSGEAIVFTQKDAWGCAAEARFNPCDIFNHPTRRSASTSRSAALKL